MFVALGDFIDGEFIAGSGPEIFSVNPVDGASVVLRTRTDRAHVNHAVDAASAAYRGWAAKSVTDRESVIARFREELSRRAPQLVEAIILETGKIQSEVQAEVRTVLARFEAASRHYRELSNQHQSLSDGRQALALRPLGTVAVIGPNNFPLHLCHAYVLPALLAGNCVIVKPSEQTPLTGQLYAEAASAAGFPPGVFNLLHGAADVASALSAHPGLNGLCFTGSYEVGQRIKEATLDFPDVLVALETGGKNMAVVFADADMRQAAHDVVMGAFLTAGQRCTATERVLVERSKLDEFIDELLRLTDGLVFGSPYDPEAFAGPMMTRRGLDKVAAILTATAAEDQLEVLRTGTTSAQGFYLTPSVNLLRHGHLIEGYSDTELFGPDLLIEAFDSFDEASFAVSDNPYGMVNSVFSRDQETFLRFQGATKSGMLNFNRSTNNSSGSLPFGGVKRSGNYRPGGSHAIHSFTFPQAVLAQPFSEFKVDPKLSQFVSAYPLARLAGQHLQEEQAELEQLARPIERPTKMKFPTGGVLPESEAWLERLYGENRVVREKKPPVFDHSRSHGGWLASVDAEPLVVLDSMSQTATLPFGFAADNLTKAYVEGAFADSAFEAADDELAREQFASWLTEQFPQFSHVAFTNSGAEANEKALGLCRLQHPERRRVLAFEGSFHGRTLLALHATWNPEKRKPYEIPGYEVDFAPYPVIVDSYEQFTSEDEFLAMIAKGQVGRLPDRFGAIEDRTLQGEIEALLRVDAVLGKGDTYACIVEPMQSEGGDRYATARFFRALRLLTRYHDVPLAMDEIQTGFGLGGRFFWHLDFELIDSDGNPDGPDLVAAAKRAQLGVCLSRFPDPEPTVVHSASLQRGFLNAREIIRTSDRQRIETLVAPKLADLQRRFPELVRNPRYQGHAFGFDLPNPQALKALVSQRFWRGAVVFVAGSHTARYRLSTAFRQREVDLLFTAIRRSLAWIDAHPGMDAPPWLDLPEPEEEPKAGASVRYETLSGPIPLDATQALQALEEAAYEPERQEDPKAFAALLVAEDTVVVLARVDDSIVGSAVFAPLERFDSVPGPAEDPFLGSGTCVYSAAITVHPTFQGQGIGKMLKRLQIEAASERGYQWLTGRNHMLKSQGMMEISRSFGAHTVAVIDGQYGEQRASAWYYRIPLRGVVPVSGEVRPPRVSAHTLTQPLAHAPSRFRELYARGALYGPIVNKLTLSNYTTPGVVRALEYISHLHPRLAHLYVTSSRDETIEKAYRILRWKRPAATRALTLDFGYFGHTTALTRSLSDPRTHNQGPGLYAWDRVAFPTTETVEKWSQEIDGLIRASGGGEAYFALFIEGIQERTGRELPEAALAALGRLREEHGIPIVVSEVASGFYRSGTGTAFLSTNWSITPDLLVWWAGGQTGLIHTTGTYFVDTPLAMITTWDGDELSLIRLHQNLMAAAEIELEPVVAAWDSLMSRLEVAGFEVAGRGLYRTLRSSGLPDAKRLAEVLTKAAFAPTTLADGWFGFAPPLDEAQTVVRALAESLD